MQNFLSLWLNAGAQITHGGQVQRPRQLMLSYGISAIVDICFYHTTNYQGNYDVIELISFSWAWWGPNKPETGHVCYNFPSSLFLPMRRNFIQNPV